MRERLRYVLGNECGAGSLEAVVLIAVFVFIASFLMVFLDQMLEFSKTRAGYSTTTGWFRTEDTDGIKN